MGKVVDAVLGGVGTLLGGGKTPKVNTAPATDVLNDADKKNKRTRTQALSTVGGISGDELSGTQVSKQGGTLFGN